MTLFTRRLIYIIFILIFLIAAPLVLLYTAGYNYNFKKGALLKTGVLLIDAVPPDAHFYLDGKIKYDTLPARLSNLKPRDYSLLINRDGFRPWKKTLTIGSGETIYATNILLPKIAEPRLLFEANIDQAFYIKESNQFILLLKELNGQARLVRFDANTKKLSDLYTFRRFTTLRLIISPNEKYIIGETNNLTLVINVSKPERPLRLDGKSGPLRQIMFEEGNDFIVYGKDGQSIIRQNILTNKRDYLTELDADYFLVRGEYLFWTASALGEPFALRRLKLFNRLDRSEIILALPKRRWQISSLAQDLLLHEETTGQFILLDGKNFKEITRGTLSNFAPPSKDRFIYSNQSEIWIKETNSQKPANLLVRLGEPIIKAWPLSKYPYALFAAPTTLSLIEEDDRDIKNNYTLASFGKINNFFLKNDELVYILAKQKEGPTGLFELELQ